MSRPTRRRSQNFWFEDGSVVLHVEATHFRVHRNVLALHSKVLRALLEEQRPGDVNEGIVDDCPVVSLNDRAEDWEEVLGIIYHGVSFFGVGLDLGIGRVAAMLRLGKKYKIKPILDQSLGRLRQEFGTRLECWDTNYGGAGGPSIDYSSPSPSVVTAAILCLGHDNDISSIMPSAFLNYTYFTRVKDIRRDTHLPQDLRARCLEGREKLIDKVGTIKDSWTNGPDFMPQATCTTDGGCNRQKILKILKKDVWHAPEGAIWSLCPSIPEDALKDVDALCASCSKSVHSHYHKARKDIWNELPSFFIHSDTSWQKIKDFDGYPRSRRL